jgi:outer membrane murein-binding lipoprotein Lpp
VALLAGAAVDAVIMLGGLAVWLVVRGRRGTRREHMSKVVERLDSRLAELTRAIDAIAAEVERIGETQRFMMLRRQSSRPSFGRVDTPH